MNTKWIFTTTRLLVLSTLVASLVLFGCSTPTPTTTSTPPTQTRTPVLTNIPITPITASPATTGPYQTWSTHFASVADLPTSGISPYQTLADIDTSNVNSGGKSIKAYVEKPSSCLNINFNFRGLVGADSVDLSDKTVSIETYVPIDSPVYGLTIDVFSGGQYVTVRIGHANLYRGQWHTYTLDIKEDIVLKTWRSVYGGRISPGLTDEQAVDILKHSQSIAIIAWPNSDQLPAGSYLLIDGMGWGPSDPAPVYHSALDSLQQHAPTNLQIGAFVDADGVMDPTYVQHLVQEFNTTIAWSGMPATEPADDAFTYDESWNLTPYSDSLNQMNNSKPVRYAWGEKAESVPAWLPAKSYAATQTILENYMRSLVSHYKGKTHIWLLFNELLQYHLPANYTGFGLKYRDKTPQTWGDNYSPFSNSNHDLTQIEDAFRVARAADPNALLFINEGLSAVEGHSGAEALYQMVAQMKRDGTPIDGVGLQCHIVLDYLGNFYEGDPRYEPRLPFDPTNGFTDIAKNVERYQALGLKVAFTEVDVKIDLADIDPFTPQGQALLAQRRQLQAAAYRSLLHIALTHPNVVAFYTWSWADDYSFVVGNDSGLFDLSFQKKPAYDALMAELKAR